MMVDLLNELEENTKFFKEYIEIRIALDLCKECINDTRNTVNNALSRIKAKEVLLNLELKNYEEDMAEEAQEHLPESDLQERGQNGPSTTG